MYRIKALNKISPAGLSVLDQSRFAVSPDLENEDGILVRSADMHEYVFPENLRAIARGGRGDQQYPHRPLLRGGHRGVHPPGANANAVKELVICAMLLASGMWWAARPGQGAGRRRRRRGKSGGEGQEPVCGPGDPGQDLGVVGLGAIGVQVANIATSWA